jgi:anion-transporting  ArsA/GET3 family ATPase
MSSIVTFLGKGGTGRTTSAIATAKKLAMSGQKVLLVGRDPGPSLGMALGVSVSTTPQEIEPNLSVVQLNATLLLEKNWEEVKQLETQYIRSPILKQVYGQELGILPGMDSALALNEIRTLDQSDRYDVIIDDGSGGMETLRMFGIPEILSWYIRRFRDVFTESDIVKTLAPFVQPVTSAILNVSWSPDNFLTDSSNPAGQILEKGTKAISDKRVIAYLTTTGEAVALATAKYYWGSAQQIGLGVGGVLLNRREVNEEIANEFAPLTTIALPDFDGKNWQPLIDRIPDVTKVADIPHPTTIDLKNNLIKVFLPGFDKKQVKLTQYGSEIAIEAGDQRRNITLPPSWQGRSVTGAKFQNNYLELTIS